MLHALKDELMALGFIGIIAFFATKATSNVFGREHMPLLFWMSVHLFHGQQFKRASGHIRLEWALDQNV